MLGGALLEVTWKVVPVIVEGNDTNGAGLLWNHESVGAASRMRNS